jgi:MFS transporter, PAT family, beta-lactamase induction signal transducer AmpG
MNLLKTKPGRLAAFGGLYFSEGLPQGFANIALILEFKRRGMDDAAIGVFAGIVSLPWVWKFLIGPLVDNLHIPFFGARKQWIVATQTGMVLSLIASLFNIPFFDGNSVVGLQFFTALIFLHNFCSASQDVAIDSLACNTLPDSERGTANGLMFGCAEAGRIVGGYGVIYLNDQIGNFALSCGIVPIGLAMILYGVITLIREKSASQARKDGDLPSPPEGTSGVGALKAQLSDYIITSFKTILASNQGRLGLLIAILPAGGVLLGSIVSTTMAPILGMSNKEISQLGLVSAVVWFVSCLVGGPLSDKIGRRRAVAIFGLCSILPGLWIGWQMKQAGFDYSIKTGEGTWARQDNLISFWWIGMLGFQVFNGMAFGSRAAFFMDIVNPKIAGTHFTAFMALSNAVTTYSVLWIGYALSAEKFNWPLWQIFWVDSLLGVLFLGILPFIIPRKNQPTEKHELIQDYPDIR